MIMALVGFIPSLSPAQVVIPQQLRDIDQTIQAQRPSIQRLLEAGAVGEALNGELILRYPAQASPQEAQLVDQENTARNALYSAQASMVPESVDDVARRGATLFTEKLGPGQYRQVLSKANVPVWWNGHLPDPRLELVTTRKVLTLPGANLYDSPSSGASRHDSDLAVFNAFSVLSEKFINGKTWYEVSRKFVPINRPVGWTADSAGWMVEGEVVPWRQAVVLEFLSQRDRLRSIIFREQEELQSLAKLTFDPNNPAASQRSTAVEAKFQDILNQGGSKDHFVEPELGLGVTEDSLLPVIEHTGVKLGGLMESKLLRIILPAEGQVAPPVTDQCEVDVVFVVDTTGSMGPYITALKDKVARFTQEVGAASNSFRFGVVGYRDHPDRVQQEFGDDLEYETRTFTTSPLEPSAFQSALSQVMAVGQKSPDRPGVMTKDEAAEEVFGGLVKAIDGINWRPNSNRFIWLVGDAPGHTLAKKARLRTTSGADEVTIREKAFKEGIGISSFHLINSVGSGSQDGLAKGQFTELSRSNDQDTKRGSGAPDYRSIDSRNSIIFAKAIQDLFDLMMDRIPAMEGRTRKLPTSESQDPFIKALDQSIKKWWADKDNHTALKALSRHGELHFDGWVSQAALEHNDRNALRQKVMVTRKQLDEIRRFVLRAIEGIENGVPDIIAWVGKGSGSAIANPTTVGDVFNMPEITDLPYKTSIMTLTNSMWRAMPTNDKLRKLADLQSMIDHYDSLASDDVWKPLVDEAAEDDWVTGLSFHRLP